MEWSVAFKNPEIHFHVQRSSCTVHNKSKHSILRSTPAGVVATKSLGCLCIPGHRLRFDFGFAVSDGHSRDQVTGPVTPPVACDSDSESSSSSSSHLNSARSRSLTAGKVCSWLTFTFSQLHLCELEEMYHDWHVSVCIG